MVSRKSMKEIRHQIRCRSSTKRKSIIDEMTPSFIPTLVAGDSTMTFKRRGSTGQMFDQTVAPPQSMMLVDWRSKSALQRFADDL